MNKIMKLTQAIRDNSDIDYGTIQTLSMIDKESKFLEKEKESNLSTLLGEVPNLTDLNIQELREIILDSGSSRNYQNKQIREWFERHFA